MAGVKIGISAKETAIECDLESSSSFVDLLRAYYNFSVGLYRDEIKFISIQNHIALGNGQQLTIRDCFLIIIMTLIIGGLKCAYDYNFDQVTFGV